MSKQLSEHQSQQIHDAVKHIAPDLYEELGPGNAQKLYDAVVGRRAELSAQVAAEMHNNQRREIQALADQVVCTSELECSCGEVFRRQDYTVGDLADMAWDWSWSVVDGKVVCPDCREDEI